MSSTSPLLFLHTGRGKAGSATIQTLASEHRAFMESAGVFCPLTLEQQSNQGWLVSALEDPRSDRQSVKKFSDDLAQADGRKIFISAEHFEKMTDDGLRRLKRLTQHCKVMILFYIREYPGWLTSLYAQRTKRALSAQDFDSFFKDRRGKVSALPDLERWAAVFGWDALRIRPLDPSVLVGGDLITDVLHALGVETPPPPVAATNLSPHWIVLECQRALAATAAAAGLGVLVSRARSLSRRLFETCSAGVKPSRVQYLTHAQWTELAEVYRSDMAALSERAGMPFPVSLDEPAERLFLPSFDAVPDAVKADIRARLHEPKFSGRMGSEVTMLIERMLMNGVPVADAARPTERFAAAWL